MRLRARPAMRRLRRTIMVAGAALLAAFGLAVAGGASGVTALAATSSCAAAYSVSTDWGSGFTANLTITDNGTAAITGWTVTYTYAGNQTLANGWNGNWTQSGKTVTVTNESYNGSLAAGASTSAGANFNYSGANAAPTSVTCTPAGSTTPPPAGSITATPASLNVAQGKTGTFTLALSQAPTANVTVTVSGSGNAGLTASPASLTFTPANYATAQTVTVTANATGTGTTTFTAAGGGYTSAVVTATETASTTGTPSLQVTPASQTITQGGTGTVGVSLSSAPSANVTVSVARTSGNTGLSVTAGSSLTFTPANFASAQSVTLTADSSSSGAATFTVSATGLTSVTFTATEAAACTSNCSAHVADPFTGAKPYLNPDYVAEVKTQAAADGNPAPELAVANYQTAIWLDTMAAIAGGTTATGTRTGLQQQLTDAAAQGTTATPSLVEIVIYDLPGRDCAALASNGEIPATAAGLTEYETQYINPIASILQQFASSPIRVVAIIEPDSLPNVVTNQSSRRLPDGHAVLRGGHHLRAERAARDPERVQLHGHRALSVARLAEQHERHACRVPEGRPRHHGRVRQHRRVHQRHGELHADPGAAADQPDPAGRRPDRSTRRPSTSTTRRSTSSATTPRCTTRWCRPGSRRARSS